MSPQHGAWHRAGTQSPLVPVQCPRVGSLNPGETEAQAGLQGAPAGQASIGFIPEFPSGSLAQTTAPQKLAEECECRGQGATTLA